MIPVTKPYLPKKRIFKRYLNNIYKTGVLTNNGPLVKELEEKLRNYLGVKNIIIVNNGTVALQIAYRLLNLSGEVITTPFSFVATVSSIVWERLKPVFVDIDSETLNIDITKIEEKISENTSAIVPVHVFGNPCEIEKIDRIAKKYKLKVIYDASHAFGVNYNNKSIFSYGDIATVSFHATKLFHTIEGGALFIKDDDLYEKAKSMIKFGIESGDCIDILGINAKMNEFQAAMGLCVLKDMDKIVMERKRIHEYYREHLGEAVRYQKWNVNAERNYIYFPVIFNSEDVLLSVLKKMNEKDIFPRRYFYPSLNLLPYVDGKKMIVSEDISKRVLSLPFYVGLKKHERDKIVKIVLRNL